MTGIHAFNGSDGSEPAGQLIIDKAGSLYGQTLLGGSQDLGTLFRLSPSGGTWTLTVLHNFSGGTDGRAPGNRLYMDDQGVLWGANAGGGPTSSATSLR